MKKTYLRICSYIRNFFKAIATLPNSPWFEKKAPQKKNPQSYFLLFYIILNWKISISQCIGNFYKSLNAPRAHDSIIALCASFCLDLALRARFYILCIHISLFLVIWFWSSNHFNNTIYVNYIFSKLLNLFLISNKKGNSIYLRLYQP